MKKIILLVLISLIANSLSKVVKRTIEFKEENNPTSNIIIDKNIRGEVRKRCFYLTKFVFEKQEEFKIELELSENPNSLLSLYLKESNSNQSQSNYELNSIKTVKTLKKALEESDTIKIMEIEKSENSKISNFQN